MEARVNNAINFYQTLQKLEFGRSLVDRHGLASTAIHLRQNWGGNGAKLYADTKISLSHHQPSLAMLAHGSSIGLASPFCSNSIEMLSGERINAMRPSRGGRFIVTPASINLLQVS